jgi:hypothetical protein
VVRIIHSLEAKGLVRIDPSASRMISLPGREGKFAKIIAELTEMGRDSL